MKKFFRRLLIGVTIAAGGFLAYSLWEDATLPGEKSNRNMKPSSQPAVPNTSTEYIERRRQQLEERAAAEKSEVQAASVEVESQKKITEKGEDSSVDENTLDDKETI